ncbi:MAG: hypothetical protein KQJ78_24670 [Deltaproteobacteria bacterium]|nr:hypothetical protein [Deltaproteobacteria bacterium]
MAANLLYQLDASPLHTPEPGLWLPPALGGLKRERPVFFHHWLAPALREAGLASLDLDALLTSRDLELREKTAQAVLAHEELGLSLTERWERSPARLLLALNATMARQAGRTPEELLELGDVRLVQHRLSSEEEDANMQTLVDFQLVYSGAGSWARPDHRPNVFKFHAVPLNWGGRILLVSFDVDVTN